MAGYSGTDGIRERGERIVGSGHLGNTLILSEKADILLLMVVVNVLETISALERIRVGIGLY